MRIKADENLPARVTDVLLALGHDVDTVAQEGLSGQNDAAIWRAAQSAERFLITQDLDFSNPRTFQPGSHHGILLLRLRDPGRDALVERVKLIFETEDMGAWAGALVIASERKIRISKPARKT